MQFYLVEDSYIQHLSASDNRVMFNKTRWDIAREKAGCPDLRLHDIRHEALSRMADKGLSVGALASQSGHRTMQTLLRYVNASETDIRKKLE